MSAEHRAELLRLAALTTVPSVQAFLQKTAASLPAEAPPQPAASVGGALAPTPAPAPAAAEGVVWVAPRHAWEQNDQFVTVLCLDLPPMLTPEAKAAVACKFGDDSAELTIPPNIRLRLYPLEKNINVAESTFKVKKTQVEILLRKREKFEHWGTLLSKGGAKSKDLLSKDPTAGIHELMKTSACLT